MKIFESKKIGRLALIAENNAHCEFGKDYILYYLYHLLSEVWDIEILLINQENRQLSSFLRAVCLLARPALELILQRARSDLGLGLPKIKPLFSFC